MNINSQFFIANYTGKEPLNLMARPSTNINDISDYNRFVEAVSTIYASQNATGGIPVFWTVRDISVDSAGNTQYTYIADTNSSLKQLVPREAYYFILRDSSYVPVRIPTVGGSLPGFAESNELPIIIPPSATVTLDQSTLNKYSFTIDFEKLQPYETYQYEVKNVFSNWPVVITPVSGIIKPSEPQTSIDLSVTFCANTGLCPSGTNGLIEYNSNYIQQALTGGIVPPSLQSTLQVEVMPISYSGLEILSKQFTIQCNDCLPKLSIDLPSESVTLSGKNNYCYDLVANVSGLVPYQEYSYEFRSIVANWPAIVTPISGVFKSAKTTNSIKAKLAFCPSTILCSSGTLGVLDYDINKYKYLFDSTCGNFVTLELGITTPDSAIAENISNQFTIYCLNCLGEINAPSLSISTSNP